MLTSHVADTYGSVDGADGKLDWKTKFLPYESVPEWSHLGFTFVCDNEHCAAFPHDISQLFEKLQIRTKPAEDFTFCNQRYSDLGRVL